MRFVYVLCLVLGGTIGCGDNTADNCAKFEAELNDCYETYCKTNADTQFCKCWTDGKDLQPDGCQCTERDFKKTCASLNMETYSGLDCGAATAIIDPVNQKCSQ